MFSHGDERRTILSRLSSARPHEASPEIRHRDGFIRHVGAGYSAPLEVLGPGASGSSDLGDADSVKVSRYVQGEMTDVIYHGP